MEEVGTSVYYAWVCPFCGNESDENSACCDEVQREYKAVEPIENYHDL